MTLVWIYETEEFRRAVREHSLVQAVDSRNRRIAGATTRAQASRLLRPYAGFLVARNLNFRLIGGVESAHGNEVFCWYEVLLRGDPEYKDFANYSQTIRSRLLNRHELDEWYRGKLETHEAEIRPKELPDGARFWLDPIVEVFETAAGDDDIVHETTEWMRSVSEVREYVLPELHGCVERVLQSVLEPGPSVVEERGPGNFGVLAQRTEAKSLFLIDILRPDDPTTSHTDRALPLSDGALRRAGRAYPWWLVADPQLWFEIERGEPLNLALSPEERNLLRAVGGQGVDLQELPMFINGHAGSGKSTMLAYIFAGLCKRMVDRETMGRPLFITYSDRLLNHALRTTRRILSAHPDFGRRYSHLDLEPLFTSWTSYLLHLLPEDRQQDFDTSRRVDFHDFKLAWEASGAIQGKLARRYFGDDRSAELVWHIIRTIIKGTDVAGDLHPDDYESELSRVERTVTSDEYRSIFQNVYEPWYKVQLVNNGLWDDQDLIEAVLASILESDRTGEIAALVVDEAQDFTRRELRLLTRTTIYSDYAIPRLNIGMRPPLVLAGDPLQTLSPTGFRWGAIRAGIFEELQGLFGDEARAPVFKELVNNYRSHGPIVRLANTIQLWRAVLFPGVDVKPQKSWQMGDDGVFPQRFVLDDNPEADFISTARDTIIVVPCEEGGEVEFIRQDSTLSKMFPDVSEVNQPDTVFTAVGIKGLEYSKVILYKFGEHLGEFDWEPRRDEGDRDLAIEYFFNKLYVAATRATHFLYVADTSRGDSLLWTRLAAPAHAELLHHAERHRIEGFAEDDLGTIEEGEDLSGVKEENPRENAIITRDYARENRNVRQMRKAASYFRRANDRREADLCEALALEFEGDLGGAGRKYCDAGHHDEAWRCLWAMEDWLGLADIAPRVTRAPDLQREAVRLMNLTSAASDDIVRFTRRIEVAPDMPRPTMPGWSAVCLRLCDGIERVHEVVESSEIGEMAEALLRLIDSGFDVAVDSAAMLFLRLGDRATSKRLLAGASGPMNPKRARLCAELDGLPAGLVHLVAAGLLPDVVASWIAANRPLTSDWTDHVLSALVGVERVELLTQLGRGAAAAEELLSARVSRDDILRLGERVVAAVAVESGLTDFVSLTESISMMQIRGRSKYELYSAGIVALAARFESDGWSEACRRELTAQKSVLDRLYDDYKTQATPVSVPALGALLELAGYTARARRTYLKYADDPEVALRKYCRGRFLSVCSDELKSRAIRGRERAEIQELQHQKAAEWKLELRSSNTPLRACLDADTTAENQFQGTGTHAFVTWMYTAESGVLRVDIDNGVTMARAVFQQGKRPRGIGCEFSPSGPATEVASVADVSEIQVVFSSILELTVDIFDGNPVTIAVAPLTARAMPRSDRATGSPSDQGDRRRQATSRQSSGRVTRADGSITKDALARELGLALTQLDRIVSELSLPPRRGNAKYSADEATRIRVHFRHKGPDTPDIQVN